MTIQHFLKSPERFKATPVVSADATIVNGTIYMTLIPTTTLAGRGTVVEQAREIFALMEERLSRYGSNKSKIAHVTVWLAHVLDAPAFNVAWNEWADPEHPPVRACAQVNMANKDIRVEMIVIAST